MARQVELEVQVEQVLERFPCDLANGMLADTRERRIQQLTEQGRANSRSTVFSRQRSDRAG